MPLVLPVILLLILGAVTLASRSSSSFLAASKQSDAQAARQAAESGLNRVLRVLTPYAKNDGDPYLSFLLFANFTKAVGSQPAGWAITKLGLSQADIEERLRRCRLARIGPRPTVRVTASASVYDRLISDVIGTTANGKRTLRYTIVDYIPPPTAKPLPSECSNFSTVTGGSALITIEGSVWLANKKLASQTITRTVEVDAVPAFEWDQTFFPFPGPPIGLRISNKGTELGNMTNSFYREINQDSEPTQMDPTQDPTLDPKLGLRPQCRSCSPAPKNGTSNFFPAPLFTTPPPTDPIDLPRFPVAGSAPKALVLNPSAPKIIDSNSPNDNSLNCAKTRKETEISCYIGSITVNQDKNFGSPYIPPVGTIRVDTSQYPINLYINGNVGGTSNSTGPFLETPLPPTTPPTPSAKNLALNDGRVAIEHCVSNCSTTPVFYTNTDVKIRPLWNRLRIFGLPSTAQTAQTFLIAGKGSATPAATSLHGTFVWLPKGSLKVGNPTYTYTYNALTMTSSWIPAKEQIPAKKQSPPEILTSWWVENLDLSNLDGKLSLISPFYGNPEAMSAILPGGYFDNSGNFIEDPRFPVYSVLPRPKSTF